MIESLLRNFAAVADLLPPHIQWAPPGHHMICCRPEKGAQNDSGWSAVHIHRGTAETLQRWFEFHTDRATRGKGPWPWLDFAHEKGPAAARVLGFSWSDAQDWAGGVRVHVEWSLLGALAVLGRVYTRFSPSFKLHAGEDVDEVEATFPCCGGLCNESAFRSIAQLLPPGVPLAFELPTVDPDQLQAAADRFERIVESLATIACLGRAEAIGAAKMSRPGLYRDWLHWISTKADSATAAVPPGQGGTGAE